MTIEQTKTRVLIDGVEMEPPTSITAGMLPSTVLTYEGALPGKYWFVIDGITLPSAGIHDLEIRGCGGLVVGGLCEFGFNRDIERECFVPVSSRLERRTP